MRTFYNMCYRSSNFPQTLIVNNSSFLGITGGTHNILFFRIYYLEQFLVKELKNSGVDSWVLTLVKPVTWWYRPVGQFVDDCSSCCWESLAWEMRCGFIDMNTCYSNLIGWVNPLHEPMVCFFTGDWIRIPLWSQRI